MNYNHIILENIQIFLHPMEYLLLKNSGQNIKLNQEDYNYLSRADNFNILFQLINQKIIPLNYSILYQMIILAPVKIVKFLKKIASSQIKSVLNIVQKRIKHQEHLISI